MHPDDEFSRGHDVATAPDFEIPRPQIKTPHLGEYAERVTWAYPIRLDGSGNYTGSGYDVRFGYKLTPLRIAIVDASGVYTPASPYTNAAAWIGLYQDDTGPGSMVDFGPGVAGGPIIPGVFMYSEDGGPICRVQLGVTIRTGPANASLVINGLGVLREA